MHHKLCLSYFLVIVGGLICQPALAQTMSADFNGVVLDRCSIDSNAGGQLGFLKSGAITYGVTSDSGSGGNLATLTISCNGGNRNLTVTAVDKVTPTPASFSAVNKWSKATRTSGGGGNTVSTYNNGVTTGAIKLSGNKTHTIEIDMRAEQSPTNPLEAGTYRFNVGLTITP